MTEWTKRTYKQNQEDLKTATSPYVDDGGKVNKIPLDKSTGALITITYAHHEIHDGDMYHCFDSSDNLGAETGDRIQLVFTTADIAKRAHIIFETYGSGEHYVTLREAPAAGTGGAAVTIYNRNRGSSNTPSAITAVTKDDSNATGGALLFGHYIGAGKTSGGSVRGVEEWILAPNTKYALRCYATADINAYIEMSWYEHVDRK